MDFLTTVLVALFGALGLGAYRYHSKALSKARSRSEALTEVIRQNKARAEQAHTTKHRELDDVSERNDGLDLDGLADAVESVFSDMSDDAGEGR